MGEMDKAEVIATVCDHLRKGEVEEAGTIARKHYPFHAHEIEPRRYTKLQMMRIFLRDGFTDRYSGKRLVFPATLRLLSHLLPEEFPAHPNWKMSESHIVYWELFPTLDHVAPVARGGLDEPANYVCTSMMMNMAKSSWTLEELGWHLHEPGDLNDWDGLTGWYLAYAKEGEEIPKDRNLSEWHSAAAKALSEVGYGES